MALSVSAKSIRHWVSPALPIRIWKFKRALDVPAANTRAICLSDWFLRVVVDALERGVAGWLDRQAQHVADVVAEHVASECAVGGIDAEEGCLLASSDVFGKR